MKTSKCFLISLSFLFCINAFGQSDTMIVYDVATQSINIIPPISFNTTIISEQTSFSYGSLINQTPLSLTPPISNLFNSSNFSNIERTELFFNLTDYPIRTATRLFRYSNDTLGGCCSGIMVGKNLVLTAAHCIINNYTRLWRGDSTFIAPAFNNAMVQPGLQNSIVKKYYIFKSYYDGNYQQDFALLELKQPIGDQIGWVGMAFNNDTSFYSNNVFHKFSYPSIVSPFDTTRIYNGDTLYYNYGKISNLSNDEIGVLSSEAIGIPGQSGSSFLYTDNTNYYSVGVHISAVNYRHYKISNNVFYQFKNIIDNYVMDIQENTSNNQWLAIYPNPTNSSITIQPKINKKENYNLILTDIHGKLMFSKNIVVTDIYKLDLTSFENGIYFLILQNDKERMVQKVIRQQ